MENRNEIVKAIHEWIFRNEIFYVVLGCAFVLVFEWLKKRVFLNSDGDFTVRSFSSHG